MGGFYLQVGEQVSFSKTIGESDIYLFAGITGDLAPNHVDETFMRATAYGRRIAHGALMVGFMSTASTMIIERCGRGRGALGGTEQPVSIGYDRVRFTAPVFIGDTITVTYTVAEIDLERRRSRSQVTITNQDGRTVAVAQHLMKWVRPD